METDSCASSNNSTIKRNSLWSSDAIWHHEFGSILNSGNGHHLNQCWLIISNKFLWLLPEGNFTGESWDIYPWYEFDNYYFNTLRPRQNGRCSAEDTFKRIFLNENMIILIKSSLKFVPEGPINNIPALVQIMAWRRPGDKPLSELMVVSLPTHICVIRPQWVKITAASPRGQRVNSLGPSDAIWRQRSGSTLAQLMACCLMAPSHYLNQCWLIISKIEWHSSRGKFTWDTSAINHWNYL